MIPAFGEKQDEKPIEQQKTIHQSDLLPRIIKRRHLQDNVIVFGTDRPTTGDDVKVYFNTTTGVLSCWNGSEWLSTTLS